MGKKRHQNRQRGGSREESKGGKQKGHRKFFDGTRQFRTLPYWRAEKNSLVPPSSGKIEVPTISATAIWLSTVNGARSVETISLTPVPSII